MSQTKQQSTKTYLSGINPSSAAGLHLGNYFGAVKPQVEFQAEANCYYFVANLHALNSVFDGEQVRQNTENVFIEYLALGIDPDETVFYVESDIQTIPYLQTILNNLVSVAEIKRMHAYKDKMQDDTGANQINMGLFSYAILMAADILIMRPDIIPVGEDQKQHVELARTIAKRFNKRYGNLMKIPKVEIRKEAARVRGTDGERKMSKSIGNDISVFADEKTVRQQIFSITTDPNRIHPSDPGDPSKNPAFDYLQLLEYDQVEINDMKDKYRQGGIKDVTIKQMLFDTFMDYFSAARRKKQELIEDRDFVSQLRKQGAQKASQTALETFSDVKQSVGI
jgi:tryptophanyl-tRNA synthetase